MDVDTMIERASNVNVSFGRTAHKAISVPSHWTLVSRNGGGSSVAVKRLVELLGMPPRQITVPPGLLTWKGLSDVWRPPTHTGPIVACGGGAVLDAAKLIRVLDGRNSLVAPGSREFFRPSNSVDLVCVPTTCGSGAELTSTASLWDEGRKRSIDDPALKPTSAIYHPDLVGPTWNEVAIASLWDAISHALESLWSKSATNESVALATFALETIVEAIHVPGKPNWEKLQIGAAASGAAIAITRTGVAHALSYPLSARNGCPHGLAAGFWTIILADFMAESQSEVRSSIAKALGTGSQVSQMLSSVWRSTGALKNFAQFVGAKDLEAFDFSEADPIRSLASHRVLSVDDWESTRARALSLLRGSL